MRKFLILILLMLSMFFVSAQNVHADQTYTLTVQSNPMIQGAMNLLTSASGIQEPANTAITLTATDPYPISQTSQWKLLGYSLDGAPIIYSTSASVVMSSPHTFLWEWVEQFQLTLTSNFGSPTLLGSGWVTANKTTSINAPQVFSQQQSQYYFQKWLNSSGSMTITNSQNTNTTVTLRAPSVVEAIYALVVPSMTNTFTTTITSTSGSQTFTSTSTGIFAHDTVTVQLQVSDSTKKPSLLYDANVTIADDTGARVWSGITDANGLTPQITLKNNLIYTVQVHYQSESFTVREQFPSSQTYPINIAQAGTVTFQEISPYIIPMFAIVVALIVIVYLAKGRNQQPQQQVEWRRLNG